MQTDPYPYHEYLLSLAVPRWNSGIGLGVTALCGTFFGVLLTNAGPVMKPTLTAVLFWCAIALTAFALQAFGRWILHPPLALAATKDGLITFFLLITTMVRGGLGEMGVALTGPSRRLCPSGTRCRITVSKSDGAGRRDALY